MNYDLKRFIIDFCVLIAVSTIIGTAGHVAGATNEKDKIHAYCVEKGFGTEDECRNLVSRGQEGKWQWKFSL
jgi:hypothetical protein